MKLQELIRLDIRRKRVLLNVVGYPIKILLESGPAYTLRKLLSVILM